MSTQIQQLANNLGITAPVNGSWIEAIARFYGATKPVNGTWLQALAQNVTPGGGGIERKNITVKVNIGDNFTPYNLIMRPIKGDEMPIDELIMGDEKPGFPGEFYTLDNSIFLPFFTGIDAYVSASISFEGDFNGWWRLEAQSTSFANNINPVKITPEGNFILDLQTFQVVPWDGNIFSN
jgi:hypothetical protein